MKRRDLSRKTLGKCVQHDPWLPFSAYGFWLPNDPRGSWSDTIRQFELLKFGPATKVTTTRSVADQPHDRKLREAAKEALRYPPIHFTEEQAVAIAEGFAEAMEKSGYVVHALAILPDHVHLVMGRHNREIDKIAAHMKANATSRMSKKHLNPMKRFISD